MKLIVLEDQRFSCQHCGKCCEYWHVQLVGQEPDKIQQLAPAQLGNVLIQHQGKTYLRHREDGRCVFFNPDNSLCYLHETHGLDAKPLGCRLFPFRLMRGMEQDVVTVTGRLDCPSIRANRGEAYPQTQLKQLARKVLDQVSPLSQQHRCELQPSQIQAVTDYLFTLLPGVGGVRHQAIFLYLFCDWLSEQAVDTLDRVALGQMYEPLRELACQLAEQSAHTPLGRKDRFVFRGLLALYLRRDEDVLDRRVGRFKRAAAIMRFSIGRATPHDLGSAHPRQARSSAVLFHDSGSELPPLPMLEQMVRGRLRTLQFMGAANMGLDLLDGLRSLCLLYPLCMGATRLFGSAEQASEAVGAIDHAFGQAAALRLGVARRYTRQLLHPDLFAKLVMTI